MIRRKHAPPSLSLSTPSPETSPRCSIAISDWDADDEGTMSAEDLVPSRPLSIANPDVDMRPSELYHIPSRPTLADVLSNSAPHPWTLSAFTAYLSQNHCLENLEFTMDAERYRERYDEMMAQTAGMPEGSSYEEFQYLRMLWQRLIDAYIIAEGAREINIPSSVRETLLSLPNHTLPPEPDVLETAVKIIYDLMEESVLISFLNEVPSSAKDLQPYQEQWNEPESSLKRRGSSKERKMKRSRSRKRSSPPASSLDVPFSFHTVSSGRLSTTSNLTTGLMKANRSGSHMSSASCDASLTDDSASASSPTGEPMTPPTTPPSSDIGGSSPRGRSDNTWKKMLVWKKKSTSGMRDNRFPTVED